MTPEELDKARAKEARRIFDEAPSGVPGHVATIAARLAREGWTPPLPVDPDLLVVREIVAKEWGSKRATEAWNQLNDERQDVALIAARLAREGWMPPPPVDPDLLAFREFASKAARSASLAESYRDGDMDSCASAYLFLAGARMAREQERERAKPLVERFSALVERVYDDARRRKRTGVNASEMISARAALAAYKAGKEAGK